MISSNSTSMSTSRSRCVGLCEGDGSGTFQTHGSAHTIGVGSWRHTVTRRRSAETRGVLFRGVLGRHCLGRFVIRILRCFHQRSDFSQALAAPRPLPITASIFFHDRFVSNCCYSSYTACMALRRMCGAVARAAGIGRRA